MHYIYIKIITLPLHSMNLICHHLTDSLLPLIHSTEVATWNIHDGSVDVFLKRPSLEGARNLLQSANVSYEVVIEDLQQAIAEENPPKEVIEQLQNRKGKRNGNGTRYDKRYCNQSSLRFLNNNINNTLTFKSNKCYFSTINAALPAHYCNILCI